MIEHDDDTVTLAGEELESIGCEGMYAHGAATWEDASKWLLERAGQAFTAGKDREAEVLRELSKEASRKSSALRKKQAEQVEHTAEVALAKPKKGPHD